MDKIITVLQDHKKTAQKLTRSSKLFKTIIRAIQDKKGEAVVSLDLKKIEEAVADYFILCEAQSPVQLKSIAGHIEKEVWEKAGEKPYHCTDGEHWILLDYVNIVIHIFQREQRTFYDLESLWEDAGRMEHNS